MQKSGSGTVTTGTYSVKIFLVEGRVRTIFRIFDSKRHYVSGTYFTRRWHSSLSSLIESNEIRRAEPQPRLKHSNLASKKICNNFQAPKGEYLIIWSENRNVGGTMSYHTRVGKWENLAVYECLNMNHRRRCTVQKAIWDASPLFFYMNGFLFYDPEPRKLGH